MNISSYCYYECAYFWTRYTLCLIAYKSCLWILVVMSLYIHVLDVRYAYKYGAGILVVTSTHIYGFEVHYVYISCLGI